jgi:hypothetical protein
VKLEKKKYSRKYFISLSDLQFNYVQATGETFRLKIDHPALKNRIQDPLESGSGPEPAPQQWLDQKI